MTKPINRSISLLWTIVFVSFMNPTIISAEEEDPPSSSFDGTNLDGFEYVLTIFKVFIILIVIIGMIILLIRFLAVKNRSYMSNRSVKTLSGVQLGQNKSIQVVEIGRSIYIIGVGTNVELIDKIDQIEEINDIKDSLHTNHNVIGSEQFAFLGNWYKKLTGMNKKEEEENEIALSFQEVFNNKMNQVSVRKSKVEEMIREQNEKERSNYDK